MLENQLSTLEISVQRLIYMCEGTKSSIRKSLDRRTASEEDRILETLSRELEYCREFSSRTQTDIATPLAIVDQMITEVFKHIKITSATRILDPACGRGTFLFQLAKRLMQELQIEIPSPKERLQYIQEQMLVGIEIDKEMADLVSSMGFNILQGDALKQNFMDKQFDVVIGNPPYQIMISEEKKALKNGTVTTSIWPEFVDLAFRLSKGLVALITPSSWASPIPSNMKRKIMQTLVNFSHIPPKTFDITLTTGWFICQKSKQSTYEFAKSYYDEPYIPRNPSIEITKILRKIGKSTPLSELRCSGNTNLNVIAKYLDPKGVPCITAVGRKDEPPVIQRVQRGIVDDEHPKSWKVILPIMGTEEGKIGNVKVVKPGILCANPIVYFPVDTEQEARNLANYLQSDFVRGIVAATEYGTTNSKALFSLIPMIDYSQAWTDEDIYRTFGLTREEIAYIKATVK